MTRRCDECLFWEAIGNSSGAGECRIHAPIATGGMMTAIETVWPTTSPEQWCGEFSFDSLKPKPQPFARIEDGEPHPRNCTCDDCIPF